VPAVFAEKLMDAWCDMLEESKKDVGLMQAWSKVVTQHQVRCCLPSVHAKVTARFCGLKAWFDAHGHSI